MAMEDIDDLEDRINWGRECMRDWMRDHPGEEACVELSDIATSFVPDDPLELMVLALRHGDLMVGDPLEHICGIRKPSRGYLHLIADNLYWRIETALWAVYEEERDREEGESG